MNADQLFELGKECQKDLFAYYCRCKGKEWAMYEDKLKEVVRYEYSTAKDADLRGYYHPSLLRDITCLGFSRGRKITAPDERKDYYRYGFNEQNQLAFSQRFFTNGVSMFELIEHQGNKELSIFCETGVHRVYVVRLMLSIHDESNRITTYAEGRFSFDDGTPLSELLLNVSRVYDDSPNNISLFMENYEYGDDNLLTVAYDAKLYSKRDCGLQCYPSKMIFHRDQDGYIDRYTSSKLDGSSPREYLPAKRLKI